ncbi:MAG: TonB-dependent receptor [Gammaproteobacteria bacterium]|jgi:vitamin B12 transporter|nr:TonB-dependent receptor [Gammaproteobacteria bacterium]MBT7603182.1 TonB-dependent receptor [Gammaproteobacteria bacterium]
MMLVKLFLYIVLLLNFSIAFSKDIPRIYISPNPSKINFDLHAGNAELIKLKKNLHPSLSNILKNYSNLSLSKSGGVASQNQLRLRGGEANHVLVLIDGMEVNDPTSGSEYDFSHLYSFNIKELEILRGAYSNVHGPDAISGVINIKTKNDNAMNLTVGSNNTNIKNYSFSDETNNFQYGVDINFLESSGVDTSGSSGDRNRYENDNARINIKSINHNLSIMYFDIFRQSDRDAAGNLSDNQLATTDINQIYSQYTYEDKYDGNIYSKYGIQYSGNKNLDFSPSTGIWETLTQSEKLKIFSNTSIELKEIIKSKYSPKLTLGFEYKKINFKQLVLDKTYGNGNQIQSEHSKSISAELLYPINNVQLEIGLRRTINQKFLNDDSHRFGITYKIKNGKLFFNHSTAIKNPTFTERFGYYTGNFNGNENLNPESIRQYEIGFSKLLFNKKLKISQTYYNMKLKNEINGYADNGNGGKTALNMESNSYRKGLESKIIYNFNNDSSMSLSHDYIDSTQFNAIKNIQEIEVRRPKNLVNFNYNTLIANDINFGMYFLYSSKIKDTDFTQWPNKTVYLNNYILCNSSFNFILDSKNKISILLNNIFNRKYSEVYGYNTPGFEVSINYNKKY